MSDETNTGIASDADRVVEGLHRIDQKVDDLRNQRLNDPDSLGDKLVKSAVPALAGLVAGKLFQIAWDKGAARRNVIKGLAADAPQGLAMSLAFAAISAAFGAIVSQLSIRALKRLSSDATARLLVKRLNRWHQRLTMHISL